MATPLTVEEIERAAAIARELERRPGLVADADADWLLSVIRRARSAEPTPGEDAIAIVAGVRLVLHVAGLIPWPPDDMPALRL